MEGQARIWHFRSCDSVVWFRVRDFLLRPRNPRRKRGAHTHLRCSIVELFRLQENRAKLILTGEQVCRRVSIPGLVITPQHATDALRRSKFSSPPIFWRGRGNPSATIRFQWFKGSKG